MQALRDLNEEADNFVGVFQQVRTYRTKNPNEVQHCHAYGEDLVLSIMKTGQTIRAFDLSDTRLRSMNEKFTRKVLKSAFGCMDLGTEKDAAKLTKLQNKVKTGLGGKKK